MKITPLGITGFIPTSKTDSSSFLVEKDDSLFLLDAGTGVRKFLEKDMASKLSKSKKLHIFFSHLHHDHTCGLTWLLKLFKGKIFIYVPKSPLVEFEGEKIIRELASPNMFGLSLEKWPNFGDIISYDTTEISVDRIKIKILPQEHSGGSVGIRIGKFAYITDTEPTDKHIDFIKNCDLVFMDTMHDKGDYEAIITNNKKAEHGWSVGNGIIASKSNIKQLGLIHINCFYNSHRIDSLLSETKSQFENTIIPQEGISIEVED